MTTNNELRVPVIRGDVLGVKVLRGYAQLNQLAEMSKADIYDQKANPTGTQRDLSPKHAREAYEYVKTHAIGFWPEVFLAVRDKSAVTYEPTEASSNFGFMVVDMAVASAPNKIAISRVDGNHRLNYADGSHPNLPPLQNEVSFCLAYDLSFDQELILFRDINDNQKRMNTSHLDNIEARLSPEQKLKSQEPDLYIARNLGQDKESPLHDRIYEGGVSTISSSIPLRALRTGIRYMLSRPTKLTALRDADAQYKVIRNYFQAVKLWQPNAWIEPGKYLVLRGAGLWGICYIGADVIDRALAQGRFDSSDMLTILKSGREWDWSNNGNFRGYSGAGGASKISNEVTAEFQHESGVSVSELFHRIMGEK